MAKASAQQVFVVNLKMTKREAETLAAVLSLVGGDPKGDRKHVDSILTALESINIRDDVVYAEGIITVGDEF